MYRLIHLLARKNGYMDLIRYIENRCSYASSGYDSPTHGPALLTQILGYGNIKATVKRPSLATNQPGYPPEMISTSVRSKNYLLSIYHQGKRSGFLESVDIFLAHRLNRGGQRLHDLSVARIPTS